MSSGNIIELGAKSAAVRRIDSGATEVWFLTDENLSVRIRIPEATLRALAQRMLQMSQRQD